VNIGDKVTLRTDAHELLAVSDLEPGAEGIILSEEYVNLYEEDGDPDGFFVEFINPRGLTERWLALTTELELIID
jgi:hypothetical protein